MKYLFIIILNSFSIAGFTQISTTVTATSKIESNTSVPYDSMINDLGQNLYQYIGQEFYLNQRPESFRKYGYSNFLVDYEKLLENILRL